MKRFLMLAGLLVPAVAFGQPRVYCRIDPCHLETAVTNAVTKLDTTHLDWTWVIETDANWPKDGTDRHIRAYSSLTKHTTYFKESAFTPLDVTELEKYTAHELGHILTQSPSEKVANKKAAEILSSHH